MTCNILLGIAPPRVHRTPAMPATLSHRQATADRGRQRPRRRRVPGRDGAARPGGARAARAGAQGRLAKRGRLGALPRAAGGGRRQRVGAAAAQRRARARDAAHGAARPAGELGRAAADPPLPRPAAGAPPRGGRLPHDARLRRGGGVAPPARGAGRIARRRQDHARQRARRGTADALRRARPRDRARGRHQPVRGVPALRPGRLPAHRAPLPRTHGGQRTRRW